MSIEMDRHSFFLCTRRFRTVNQTYTKIRFATKKKGFFVSIVEYTKLKNQSAEYVLSKHELMGKLSGYTHWYSQYEVNNLLIRLEQQFIDFNAHS